MRRLLSCVVLLGAARRMRQLEAGRYPEPARPLRNAHPALQHHPVLSAARPSRRRRSAAVRRHRRLRRRARRLGHRRRRALAREPGARLSARGQRLRRPLSGEHLAPAGGRAARWTSRARRSFASPRFQETLRADESILFQQVLRIVPGAYKVNVAVRDVGSTSESRATQALHGAELRQGQLQRADPGVPGDGAGKPGRPALARAQSARRGGIRQRYAARLRRGLRLRRPHHRSVPGVRRAGARRSIPTRSDSAAAGRSRARWCGSHPTASRSASSSW